MEMDNGPGQMGVNGLAGQTGILGNHQQEEIMTILSSGGVRTIENGTMFKNLTEEEFYVNMTQHNNCFILMYTNVPHVHIILYVGDIAELVNLDTLK